LSVVSFKCPACGAPLIFDPEQGTYACEYCESTYTQAQLDALEQKQVEKEEVLEDVAVYMCPSCGAQIVTSVTTAATYCYYCHNAVIMAPRLTNEWKPDRIIPFAIDKKEAVDRFLTWVKGKRYVPRDFFSADQIEKITGVYYPYWVADYHAQADFTGEGTRVNTVRTPTHDVVTTQHYAVARGGMLRFFNMIRPALSSADRSLDAGIHPFDLSKLEPFTMGYLSGFQAERRDVETSAIEGELESDVRTYCEARLKGDATGYNTLHGMTNVQVRARNYEYILLPSWVLTYRGRDGKMYYYTLNGQTGAVCGNLPVDKKKINRDCLLWAAIAVLVLLVGGWLIW